MKYRLLIPVMLSLLFTNCKKQTSGPQFISDPSSSIVGRWYWTASSGGIAGVLKTPSSEGYTQIAEFHADSTYSLYQSGKLLYNSRYSVGYGKIFLTQDSGYFVTIGSGNARQILATLTGTQLVLQEDA